MNSKQGIVALVVKMRELHAFLEVIETSSTLEPICFIFAALPVFEE